MIATLVENRDYDIFTHCLLRRRNASGETHAVSARGTIRIVNVKDVKSVTDLTFFASLLTCFQVTLIAAISRATSVLTRVS
jgi:hypothetical protein